mmetsp:Transcript_42798/g.46469  ORF Transcript_42798/g.46469 Transcript_42798/m.46469 type:complete len:216 (-) Transcript_42798:2308-2955(-)
MTSNVDDDVKASTDASFEANRRKSSQTSIVDENFEAGGDLVGWSSSTSSTGRFFNGGTTAHTREDDDSMIMTTSSIIPPPQLAYKEIQKVCRVNYFIICFLTSMTITIAFVAYFVSSVTEESDFVTQFNEDALKIVESMGKNLVPTLQNSDAFTVSITLFAMATKQPWLFVVVPDFGVRVEKIRALAHAVLVNTYIYVEPDERTKGENFTAETGE